jgi:hypothetical protein
MAASEDFPSTVFNALPLLGTEVQPIWPRGLPVDLLKSSYYSHENPLEMRETALHLHSIGIVQFMVNDDPDVDSLFLFVQPGLVEFPHHRRLPLLVPASTEHIVFAPYNSHATLHFKSMLWALLVPGTVPARVSDIWRSFITQRLMNDFTDYKHIIFHPPIFAQTENRLTSVESFLSEHRLFTESSSLLLLLQHWTSCKSSLVERMEDLYIYLFEHNVLDKKDVTLAQAWLQSLVNIGYSFPMVSMKSCTVTDPASK